MVGTSPALNDAVIPRFPLSIRSAGLISGSRVMSTKARYIFPRIEVEKNVVVHDSRIAASELLRQEKIRPVSGSSLGGL